jgi:hypothetical protein
LRAIRSIKCQCCCDELRIDLNHLLRRSDTNTGWYHDDGPQFDYFE